MAQPSAWSQSGRPCYRTGSAPSFLWTEKQLRDHGLRPATGAADAFVESQHGPAALYLITECELQDPSAWPPTRPTDGEPGSDAPTWRV